MEVWVLTELRRPYSVGTRSYRLSAQHYVTLNAKEASPKLGVIFKWRELCLQNMAVKDLSSKFELLDAFVTFKKETFSGWRCMYKEASFATLLYSFANVDLALKLRVLGYPRTVT